MVFMSSSVPDEVRPRYNQAFPCISIKVRFFVSHVFAFFQPEFNKTGTLGVSPLDHLKAQKIVTSK